MVSALTKDTYCVSTSVGRQAYRPSSGIDLRSAFGRKKSKSEAAQKTCQRVSDISKQFFHVFVFYCFFSRVSHFTFFAGHEFVHRKKSKFDKMRLK